MRKPLWTPGRAEPLLMWWMELRVWHAITDALDSRLRAPMKP
jgi:hypothetical protein